MRVLPNEDCWLGINGAPAAYSGATYQQAIATYVSQTLRRGCDLGLQRRAQEVQQEPPLMARTPEAK